MAACLLLAALGTVELVKKYQRPEGTEPLRQKPASTVTAYGLKWYGT
jgi:hypothetical protein